MILFFYIVNGNNFGPDGSHPQVQFGTSLLPVAASNNQILRFILPQGFGTKDVSVIVGGQTSSTTQFVYDGPRIASIQPGFGPTSGRNDDFSGKCIWIWVWVWMFCVINFFEIYFIY